MRKSLPKDNLFGIFIAILVFTIILLVLNLAGVSFGNEKNSGNEQRTINILSLNPKDYPELAEVGSNVDSFERLSDFFEDIALKKGGAYAFNVLRLADLPPGTDMHLLGHVVGDVLYKQDGLDGIHVCTQDFRNACSHSIVVGLFYDQGESALGKIAETCRNAPGGKGAYTMCFHGLGHGVLAHSSYDLEKAVTLCDQTSTAEYGGRESVECVGGTIMEIIGGVHDREAWERQYKNYFKDEDPLYPCTADFMSDEVRGMCYNYLTPHLFEAAGGSLENPIPSFKEAFTFCDAIPPERKSERTTCFGGFGKEFIVLAKDRDIRDIGTMTEIQVKRVYDWCKLAPNREGTDACLQFAMSSMYWGGENDYGSALKLCSIMTEDKGYRDNCYNGLVGNVHYYQGGLNNDKYIKDFCQSLPEEYQSDCGLENI